MEADSRHQPSMKEFKKTSLHLRRLLHTMTITASSVQEYIDNKAIGSIGDASTIDAAELPTEDIQREQIQVAQSMLKQLDEIRIGNQEENSAGKDGAVMKEGMMKHFLALQESVNSVCDLIQNQLDVRKSYHDGENKQGIIEKISIGLDSSLSYDESIKDADSEFSYDDEDQVEDNKYKGKNASIDSTNPGAMNEKNEEEVLQKEIAAMTQHLKQRTHDINSKLASQNQELNGLQDQMQSNLDRTKNVSDKVEGEVKSGWRKSAGRWLTFFIVLGTFIFMTALVVTPGVSKRKNACIFFCPSEKNDQREHSEKRKYQQKTNQEESYRQEAKPQDRDVTPKFSYCDSGSGDDQRRCSKPEELSLHERKLNYLDTTYDAEEVLDNIINDKREKRVEQNTQIANNEADDIGLNRVKDVLYEGTDLRQAAKMKRDDIILSILSSQVELVDSADKNGWNSLHEAVRAGCFPCVQNLLKYEAKINARTGVSGDGASPLYLAHTFLDENDPIIDELVAHGGIQIYFGQKLDASTVADYDNLVNTEEVNVETEKLSRKDEIIMSDIPPKEEEEMNGSTSQMSNAEADNVTVEFTKDDMIAAARSDSSKFSDFVAQRPEWLLEPDRNGWLPLHEAVRAGNIETVSMILSLVKDEDHVNKRVGPDGNGFNSMWLAENSFDEGHPMILLLGEKGGVRMNPMRTEL